VLLLAPNDRQQPCNDTVGAVAATPDGWRLRVRERRFSMYEPTTAAASADVAEAFVAFGSAAPPECGYSMIGAAAALLDRQGDGARARRLLADVVAGSPDAEAPRIQRYLRRWLPGLAPVSSSGAGSGP